MVSHRVGLASWNPPANVARLTPADDCRTIQTSNGDFVSESGPSSVDPPDDECDIGEHVEPERDDVEQSTDQKQLRAEKHRGKHPR